MKKNKMSNLSEPKQAKENSTSGPLSGTVPIPSTPNILEKEALSSTNSSCLDGNMPASDSAMELMQEDVAKVAAPNSWEGSREAQRSLSSGTSDYIFNYLIIVYVRSFMCGSNSF